MMRLVVIGDALEHAGLLQTVPTSDRSHWPEITGVTADTRRLQPGMLFCAVRGAAMDGHRFVADAARAGAAAALVEEAVDAPPPLVQLVVRDGRRAAAVAAETWYGRPATRLHLVAVTGTNGKTTSVMLCRHVLSAIEPTGSIGTLGAFDPAGTQVASEAGNLTTPGPIDLQATLAALVQHGARGVVMEASSHSLDQGRIDGLAFRAAIFTNLTRDHLDYHGTLEAYFRAKARLLEYLAPGGIAVVNADDPAWIALPPANGRRRITFGETAADVMARDVMLDARGSRFTLVTPAGTVPVTLPLLGRFNVSNALGVAACAFGLDVPLPVIGERLTHAPQVPGRMERLATRPCVVLRDYAHTPDALERAIDAVRPFTTGRLIVVFGCGGDRDRGKRPEMGRIAVDRADVAIATSDNPRTEDPEQILDDIEAGMHGAAHERIEDRRSAIARALAIAAPQDVVLLAGKGHETYQVRGTTKFPFDERAIVREIIQERQS